MDTIALRAVQQGDIVHLQVRIWNKRDGGGCLLPFIARRTISPEMMYADLQTGFVASNADPHAGWQTLHTVIGTISRVGLSIRTFDDAKVYCRLAADPSRWDATGISAVSVSSLIQDIPRPGPRVVNDNEILIPYRTSSTPPNTAETYPDTATVHSAPKFYINSAVGKRGDGRTSARKPGQACIIENRPRWV